MGELPHRRRDLRFGLVASSVGFASMYFGAAAIRGGEVEGGTIFMILGGFGVATGQLATQFGAIGATVALRDHHVDVSLMLPVIGLGLFAGSVAAFASGSPRIATELYLGSVLMGFGQLVINAQSAHARIVLEDRRVTVFVPF